MELSQKFIQWMDKEQGYDPKTTKMYTRMTTKFLLWLKTEGEDISSLTELTAGTIRNYRNYLLIDCGLKASTVNKSLQSTFKICTKDGELEKNKSSYSRERTELI
jgi:site-specific recombinase XerD